MSQLITCIVIITQWLLAHAAVSKSSVILFLVLVLSRTYLIHTHMYRRGTRNRKRRSWKVEGVPVVIQERSSKGKAKEGLEKIVWRLSSRRRVFDSTRT